MSGVCKMKVVCSWLLLIVCCFGSIFCASEELTVAAAADLQFLLPELTHQFEQQTGNTVKVIFGSSGIFSQQIQSGAPFDMFFSADLSYPKGLEAAGLIEPGTMYHYADGRIVL